MRARGIAVLAAAIVGGGAAEAHEAPAVAGGPPGESPSEAAPGRWRGSILLFDQSVTTQTFGVGRDYQSYDPTYEWWVAVKPRYTILDRGPNSVTANLWLNAYLELTNSDTTTREHEILLGPTYLWASYTHLFRDGPYKGTVSIGPRLTLPTDKAAWDAGQILGFGAIGGGAQSFPLAGPKARAFNDGRIGLTAAYAHYWDRATSPVDGGLHRQREDLNGLSVPSDVLSGSMMARDSLSVSVLGDLHLMRRLDLSLSYVVINYWLYPVRSYLDCVPLTGCVTPGSNIDPTTFRVNTWVTAAVTYDLSEELGLSVGYYNLANQVGPDGSRRSPLWSPSARFFLTATANLDAIQRRFTWRH